MTQQRPCILKHPEPVPDQCGLCRKFIHDPRYRALWSGQSEHAVRTATSTPSPPVLVTPPCVHFDDTPTLRTAPDGTACACPAKWLYGCDLHGKCARTTVASRDGVQCCASCPDFDDGNGARGHVGAVRHLLYHIYPIKGSVWRWNVEQLLSRIDLFNGVRAIAVAVDRNTVSHAEVRAAFAGHDVEMIEATNDPTLREVATFEPLFSRVADRLTSEDVTLYAHAKGVTRPKGSTAHRWTEVLYELYMERWQRIEALLWQYPVVGAFKKIGRGWKESNSQWHYSGSWVWVRNRDFFARNWRNIDRFWSGIESMPSNNFQRHEAGCIFMEGKVGSREKGGLELYDARAWEQDIEPALTKWRAEGGLS